MFDAIMKAFPGAVRSDVIFSWGDRIYVLRPGPISAPLLAHEAVHGGRQTTNELAIEHWWVRYMDDPAFRLAEEIPAHIAEFQAMCIGAGRNDRRRALSLVAGKLAAPLYGRLISKDRAKDVLAGDVAWA